MQYFLDLENRASKEIVSGIRIKTFWGDETMLSMAYLDANAILPEHSHPQEQTSTIVSGELTLTINGETRVLKAGNCSIIPGGVVHSGKAGAQGAQVADVFSPVREDYKY